MIASVWSPVVCAYYPARVFDLIRLVLLDQRIGVGYVYLHIYIYIYIYIFIGSASAADLFFCIFVSIIYGIWDALLCAIGFALKFCIELIGRNVISVIFAFFMFFATWDVLNHAFLIQMAAYGSICTHTNAYRYIYNLFSCIFIDFQWFSLISTRFEAIWGQRVGRPVAACGGLWRAVAGLSYPFKMMQ